MLMRLLRDIIAEPGDGQTRLDKIVKHIAGVMVAEVCSIYLKRQDGSLELFATEGLNPSAVHNTRMKRGEGLVGRCAEMKEPVNEPEAPSHPAFSYRPETGEEIYHALLAVPILRSGEVLGVLVIQNRKTREYSDEDVEVLQATAMIVAEMIAEHHYNPAEADQRARLTDSLRKPGQQPHRPDPLIKMPAGYVPRLVEYNDLKTALLDAAGNATTATVVLSGSAGSGKTVLADALGNDVDVQQAYFNGILRVELGDIPNTYDDRLQLEGLIKTKIETLIKVLTGEEAKLDDLQAAKNRLKEILKLHNGILLWIEDAQAEDHVRHFIDAAPTAAKLITTRVKGLFADGNATQVSVGSLAAEEAFRLISQGLPEPDDGEMMALYALASRRAGGWPLLITLMNKQLRQATTPQSGGSAKTLLQAIMDLNARLDREDLDAIDPHNVSDRNRAVEYFQRSLRGDRTPHDDRPADTTGAFVFVSHAAEDKPLIRPVVQTLIDSGIKVWLDRPLDLGFTTDVIEKSFYRKHAGGRWQDEIHEAMREASCILVCWSKHAEGTEAYSRHRTWFDEVAYGRMERKLVGCRIDDVNPALIPEPYSEYQIPDVREKSGRDLVVADVQRVIDRNLRRRVGARQASDQPQFASSLEELLFQRATTWDSLGRPARAALKSRNLLSEAEAFLAALPASIPPDRLTLYRDFISASRILSEARKKRAYSVIVAAIALSLLLSAFVVVAVVQRLIIIALLGLTFLAWLRPSVANLLKFAASALAISPLAMAVAAQAWLAPTARVLEDPAVSSLAYVGVPMPGGMGKLDLAIPDPRRGKPRAHDGAIADLAISPGGKLAATSGTDGKVKMWDLATGSLLWSHQLAGDAHQPLLGFAKVARSGNLAIFVSDPIQGQKSAYDSATGRPVREVPGTEGKGAVDVSILRRGASIVLAGNAEERGTGGEIPFAPTVALEVASGDNSPGFMVFGLLDGTIRTEDNGIALDLPRVHNAPVRVLAVTYEGFASGAADGSVVLWRRTATSFEPSNIVHKTSSDVCGGGCTSIVSTGSALITAGTSGEARFWDRQPRDSMRDEFVSVVHGASIEKVFVSSNVIITLGADGIAKVWQGSNRPQGKIIGDWIPAPHLAATIRCHGMPITLADVTPDGRTLVTATLDGTVRVTDLQTAVMMAPFDPAPIFEQHVQPLLKAAVAKVDAWFGRLQEQPAPSGTEDYLRGDPFRLHALLIGVSRYPKLQAYQQLPRAVVDAQGLQSVLVEKLKVPPDNIMLLTEHSSLSTIETAYRNHLAKLRPNDVSLVFFSGHGVQEVDRPYLLPADFDPRQAGAAISGIRLDELLERFQQRRSNNLGIFIVDAAPVAIASTQEVKVPASLGPVQAPEGTFVLYSASAGQVALSNLGTGDTSQYSVFMRRLLELLPDTQLGLTELASRLRYDVYNLAQHRRTESGALAPHVQTPAYYDGLVERRNILGQLLPPRPQ